MTLQEEEGQEKEEERFVPALCYYRILCPLTAFFKVHRRVDTEAEHSHDIPALTQTQWATLFVCCLCNLLGAYDWELYPLTLEAFQLDLNISETDIGLTSSAIRMGNAFSLPICLLADSHGRKRMMLWSSALYLLFISACGLAQTAWVFTLMQVLARAFMSAQTTMSTTLLVEALNASDRGWGIGTFSAIGVLGSALALVVFGFVGDLPGAWRALYLTSGIFFLPFLLLAATRMPESHRFLRTKVQHSTKTQPGGRACKLCCGPSYRGRMLVCCLVSALNGFSFAPSETFKVKKLMQIHELSSAEISLVQILTGLIAFASFTLAGSLSDLYGRRRFLVVFNAVCSLGAMGFFWTPRESGAFMYLMNFVHVLSGFVLITVKSAYFAELFSTSNRALAQGWFVVCDFTFGALALLAESWLYSVFQEHWFGCGLLALPALASSVLIAYFLPEASARELEHISPEEEEEEGIEM